MRLYGIGVGPGDPELITLKAARLLAELPLVFYPTGGRNGESLALAIARPHLPPTTRLVPLPCMSGLDAAEVAAGWRRNARLVRSVIGEVGEAGFLTEGDPLLYSTFTHLASALQEEAPEVELTVVPAVSSVTAAAAAARFPLALGAERLLIVPASRVLRERPAVLLSLLEANDAVVLLKVARVFAEVMALLQGQPVVTVLVERLGLGGERIVPNPTSLVGETLDYFSLLLIRKVRP